MTEAEIAIRELDAALAQYGQSVTLRRVTLTNGVRSNFDAPCKASVRNYQPQELVTGTALIQGDSLAVLSPTDLRNSGWPGTQTELATDDQLIPRKDDKLVVSGRERNVQAATPFFIGDALVRLELQCRG